MQTMVLPRRAGKQRKGWLNKPTPLDCSTMIHLGLANITRTCPNCHSVSLPTLLQLPLAVCLVVVFLLPSYLHLLSSNNAITKGVLKQVVSDHTVITKCNIYFIVRLQIFAKPERLKNNSKCYMIYFRQKLLSVFFGQVKIFEFFD